MDEREAEYVLDGVDAALRLAAGAAARSGLSVREIIREVTDGLPLDTRRSVRDALREVAERGALLVPTGDGSESDDD